MSESPAGGADHQALLIKAETAMALHRQAMRRQFDVIREVYGREPPHVARDSIWIAAEIALAELQGQPIALRDLTQAARDIISVPTLSRIVRGLVRDGWVLHAPRGGDSRVKPLHPTPRLLTLMLSRAAPAYAEFEALLQTGRDRLAARGYGKTPPPNP